jgi:hypothetical protein
MGFCIEFSLRSSYSSSDNESSVVTLDHEDLLEVLQSAKEAGVSVG